MTNGSQNYKLGELAQAQKDMIIRLDRLEVKVDSLNIWRWKIVVAVSVMAAGGNVTIDILKNLIQ